MTTTDLKRWRRNHDGVIRTEGRRQNDDYVTTKAWGPWHDHDRITTMEGWWLSDDDRVSNDNILMTAERWRYNHEGLRTTAWRQQHDVDSVPMTPRLWRGADCMTTWRRQNDNGIMITKWRRHVTNEAWQKNDDDGIMMTEWWQTITGIWSALYLDDEGMTTTAWQWKCVCVAVRWCLRTLSAAWAASFFTISNAGLHYTRDVNRARR